MCLCVCVCERVCACLPALLPDELIDYRCVIRQRWGKGAGSHSSFAAAAAEQTEAGRKTSGLVARAGTGQGVGDTTDDRTTRIAAAQGRREPAAEGRVRPGSEDTTSTPDRPGRRTVREGEAA